MEPAMDVLKSSVTFMTRNVPAVRNFYDRYFDTWYPFDCGWYVLMRLGKTPSAPEIGFMQTQADAQDFSAGAMWSSSVRKKVSKG
jgi:hypothetical protein